MVAGKNSKSERRAEKKVVLKQFSDVLRRAGLPDEVEEEHEQIRTEAQQANENGQGDRMGDAGVAPAEPSNEVVTDQQMDVIASEEQQMEVVTTEDGEITEELLGASEYMCVRPEELQVIAESIHALGENQMEIIKMLKTLVTRQGNHMEYNAKNDVVVAEQLEKIIKRLPERPGFNASQADRPGCSRWSGPRANAEVTPQKERDGSTPAKRKFTPSAKKEFFICIFCDMSDHQFHDQCYRVTRVSARLAILKKKNLCVVCLNRAHPGTGCRSLLGTPRRCHHCQATNQHHSSVCPCDEHRDRIEELREEDFNKD